MKTAFYHSLYFKLSSALALMFLIVGAGYALFSMYMAQQINQASYQAIYRGFAQKLVENNQIVNDGLIDQQHMQMTFMKYMKINPGIELYQLDMRGNILAYSAEPGKVKLDRVDLEPVRQWLKNPDSGQIVGEDPRFPGTLKPFSVAAIPDAINPQGYLYVMLQSEALSEQLNQQSQHSLVYLGAAVITVSLLTGLGFGLYIFWRINRRIARLSDRVSGFIASGFDPRKNAEPEMPDIEGKDEISDLERGISKMINHIHKQWSALKQQDELRREMVANISHDLRTPLASLQGYLETLSLKYQSLDDADRENYLATSVKQAKGLEVLIDSLFELAKLDAQEQKLELETFPVLELLYDVVAKFQLVARERNITLKVQSEIDNPLVYADLGLIERVVDNLISNALHYSYRDSEVIVKVSAPANGSLTVGVMDRGEGIAEDQKELVFERFHQAHSPHRNDGHAGLGLCIVKKIIELHSQKVWVDSQPQKGSVFHFTLTAA